MTRQPRRSFVKKASLLCGASLFASTAPQSLAAFGGKRGIGGIFSDRDSTARIARAYLEQVPDAAASAATLDAEIAALDLPHDDALRRYLRQRIAADFGSGDTVTLDGWLLARAEVDACLLSLRG